jgi:hypothetical protein
VVKTAAGGTAQVTVDGKDQSISGKMACFTTGDTTDLTVGDQSNGATTAEIKGEDVTHVVIANNASALTFVAGPGQAPGTNAKYTKDGNKYSLSGKLMGMDGLAHEFTMDVTCP